jgi:hypothetical protein
MHNHTINKLGIIGLKRPMIRQSRKRMDTLFVRRGEAAPHKQHTTNQSHGSACGIMSGVARLAPPGRLAGRALMRSRALGRRDDPMSVHSRSRRRNQRQQNNRPAQRSAGAQSHYAPDPAEMDEAALAEAEAEVLAPAAPRSAAPQATPRGGAARTYRRAVARPAPEPIDYSADYDAARRDLRWIALWSVLLFGAMIALAFSGLV